MRILHTSDWHLGRQFHRASLHREHQQVLERIAELVVEHRIELVVVAGDLYDRAIPPSDAVTLFDDTLVRLRDAGTSVVAISGNHDSAVRVGFADRLLSGTGVTIRGDTTRAAEPVILEASDGGPPVAVYPVPYLDPLAHTGAGSPRVTHDRLMRGALDRVRADLAGRSARSVVVAHTFVNGATPCESERQLTVGDVELVGLDAFDGIDYVALGHLHQGQAWCDDRIAYSGTPLPFSFSEEHHTKSVRIVDLAPDGSIAVQVVPLAVGRALRTLHGDLHTLLTDPTIASAEPAFVRAVLTDRHLPLQAMNQLRNRFPHAVELRHVPAIGADITLTPEAAPPDVRGADPFDLSLRFLDEQRGFPVDGHERHVLTTAFDQARREAS